MKSLLENFSSQLKKAVEIGEGANIFKPDKPIQNVLISGMGGSGIGGTIVTELATTKSKIPLYVSKSYFLPEYVNENTLVIISSYSGNTEETIQSLEDALEKNAKIVCISSGGKILDLARAKKIDHITIPGGMPPRAGIGYSIVQMLYTLYYLDIITEDFKTDLGKAINLLETEKEAIKKEAERITNVLLDKLVVIYTPARSEGVAVRFRQDLNENAKMLAWHNTIPEMNHNELVGWTKKEENIAVVFFRNQNDYSRIAKRIELTKEVVEKYAANVIEIYSKGDSIIERTLYHIHISDWISTYLAEDEHINADKIEVIEYLKSSLGQS